MTIFSPIPAYALGAACFGRGVMGVLSPREEYGHVGLPLESHICTSPPATADGGSTSGFVSPLMYFKGIREISYGLTMMALQRQGNEDALTTVAAVLTLVRFGDGLVVWLYGGEKLRFRAWGHWITSAGFLGWVMWRWR
ncbi:hypothetical protein BGZ61DRAFT_459221 [Ilyonectria robusta]|uniref:uncharacterized protein n=1 Tax=Ilyonectria robusta TaxID=1079257 RepID=UPI001E8D02F2|nr:uncharacterized protein BGZ61DRAFT_459221 [Ilyonectria robusta]KAH8672380.1 hypothetical protein BGZ61DRAFT_459221 [Ilyonectria robusta]